jgi:hypothetical protein
VSYKINWDALDQCATPEAVQEWLRLETEAQMKAYTDDLHDMRLYAQRRIEDLNGELTKATRRE